MIEIFIDGRRAIPAKDSSIKLTLINQYFDTTSDFSYEVELPLDISENRNIFGYINRRDVVVGKLSLPARLVCDNHEIIRGSATVTNIDNNCVKVQLLGEITASQTIQQDSYIDEMDLGNWYTRYFSVQGDFRGSSYIMVQGLMKVLLLQNYPEWDALMFNSIAVSYPIYNSEADTVCNAYIARQHTDGTVRYELPFTTPDGSRNGEPQVKLAIQPFVWYMCEIIASACGYTITRDENYLYENDFFRRIFIANANINVECSKCLPHWTIAEWWENIEKSFGVAVRFDDYKKTAKILLRDKYINTANTFFANTVLDEYSVSLEDSAEYEDLKGQNVGYAETNNLGKEAFFPDDILDFATLVKFDTFDEFHEYLKTFNHNEENSWGYIFECEGRHYIWQDTGILKEVNMLRNRNANSEKKDVDVELKFIPCKFERQSIRICDATTDSIGYTDNVLDADHTVEMLSRPDKANFDWYTSESELIEKKSLKLKDWVFDEAETPQKEETFDVCYIAIHNPDLGDAHATRHGNFVYPRALLHESETIEENYFMDFSKRTYKDKGYSLSLQPIEGQRNFASETVGKIELNVDTSIKYCFKFVSSQIPSPNDIFVVNNKRFICDRIEITFDEQGLDNVITGYFFAVS